MKNNNRFIAFGILALILLVLVLVRNYNKPENILERAKKSCIKDNYEYRVVLNSDGKDTNVCVVDGKKIDIIEYYNNRNKK